MEARTQQPIYLVIDTSGSTVRDRWIDACNSVLPRVVESLEERQGHRSEQAYLLCLLTYATTATLQFGLMDVSEINTLPALTPGGFSSLASALALLNEAVIADMIQLRSDGMGYAVPKVTVVMHGLPTDSASELVTIRSQDSGGSPSMCLHAVCPVGVDPLALRGLGFHTATFVEDASASSKLAAAVVGALVCDDHGNGRTDPKRGF